jgi:hypothetical protein
VGFAASQIVADVAGSTTTPDSDARTRRDLSLEQR